MVGHQLRSTESSLTEEPDSLREIFVRLQPCARVEDLLSSLPSFLISVGQPFERSARRGVPLPVEYLTVGLTPSWCQVFLNTTEVGMTNERGRRGELVVEVRRGKGSEETVQRIGKGLGELRAGTVGWGDRVG
ncbi:hypothetical protein M231_03300 [Tremella mesenterica]|uniref:Uncharacterized protein n=1 Tax=Tremella mesenterica TaxID=5217 RepID=A0A4V1M483_TREME|nr:hypothetical protein M231_03300 [Tremella mesenterica]